MTKKIKYSKIRKNKKAIELAINFVVVMILSIAILSSSFILVKQFFGKAGEMKARLDTETETKIRSLLISGERVAIPLHTKTVKQGEPVTFGIGISNVLKEGDSSDKFTIEVVEDACEPISGTGESLEVQYMPELEVDKNDQGIALIVVDTKESDHGITYKCDIKVTYYNTNKAKDITYADTVYKAYIKIK